MPTRNALDEDTLLFRRQFILGPRPKPPSRFWNVLQLAEHQYLTTHPDLSVGSAEIADRRVVCIGYAFHASQPELAAEALLAEILATASDFARLEDALKPLGGRFLIWTKITGRTRVYPDAIASRPVFYAVVGGDTWLASSPGLLASVLGLPCDEHVLDTYRSHKNDGWWPGDRTPFAAVRRLYPNHFFDWDHYQPVRFWPKTAPPLLDLEEAARAVLVLLQGVLRSASNRYPLNMALTAGYDSRVLLAASRNLHREISFYTVSFPDMESYDISVPAKLARKLGLKYAVVPLREPDERILSIFDQNVTTMVAGQCRTNVATYLEFPSDALMVEGTASEVGRAYYHNQGPHPEQMTPEWLSAAAGFAENPVAIAGIREWLASVPSHRGINLLDLYYWEQRLGGWNAMDYTGQEISRQVFSPFNCRQVLELFLGTPTAVRLNPYRLHRLICELGLPEVRSIPFNFQPEKRWRRLAGRAWRALTSLLGRSSSVLLGALAG